MTFGVSITEAQELVDESRVEEGSIGDGSPSDLALLRLAVDIRKSIMLRLEDRLSLSGFIVQITE